MKAITYIPTGAALLPAALKLDAVVTGANGAAYLALGGPLGDLLGVPASTLRMLGAFLLVFAIGVWAVAARPHRAAVSAVIGANELWVAASIVVLIADTWTPSTAGAVWTAMQAATVAAFAVLQLIGLRRTRAAGLS